MKQSPTAPTFKDGLPVEDGAGHEHHAVPGHSSGGGVVDVVYLKDDLAVWSHGDTVSVSQGQGFIVVQHRVQVLNPDGIYRAVQQQPHMLTLQELINTKQILIFCKHSGLRAIKPKTSLFLISASHFSVHALL